MLGPVWKRRQVIDTVLIYPVVLGVFQAAYAIDSWPTSTWDLKGLALGTAILASCAIASTEPKLTIGAGLGFMCFVGLVGIPLQAAKHTLQEILVAIAGSLLCGVTAGMLVASRGRGPEPYTTEGKSWPMIVSGLVLTTLLVVALYRR